LCPVPSKASAPVVSKLLHARKRPKSARVSPSTSCPRSIPPQQESEGASIPRTSHSIVPVPKISHNANLVSARVPDTLEETVPLGEAVDAVVALAHCAHEAAKRVDLVLAGVAAVLVNLGDADLDGAVVLGLDDAVGRAALAGDVPAQRKIKLVCILFNPPSGGCPGAEGFRGCSLRISGVRLQVDKLAAVVFHFDGCVGGERRFWVVSVAARVLICRPCRLSRSLCSSVVKFAVAVGFAAGGTMPLDVPPSPKVDHVHIKYLQHWMRCACTCIH
jgi:hypothetical protein